MIIQQIVDLIDNNEKFLIAAHENPDGDAIGSTLGLALALKEMGKDVIAFNADPVPEPMRFLPGSDLLCNNIPPNAHFPVAFVLDAGAVERTRLPVEELCDTLINIDHHPHSDFGDLCFVDTEASATAVLIYRLLTRLDSQISLDVAKALYLGLMSDTGSFRYSSANAEAFDVAGRLISAGIDPWETASNLYESYAPERMRLLGLVLPTLEVSSCGRYAFMFMERQHLVDSGAVEEHADGFVNYPRAVRGVEVALFFSEIKPNYYKVSMRSRGTIDVGALARELDGGGHHNAAGAKVTGSRAEVINLISVHLDKILG